MRRQRLEGGPPDPGRGGAAPPAGERGSESMGQVLQGGQRNSPEAGDSHLEAQEPLGRRYFDFTSIWWVFQGGSCQSLHLTAL